MFSSELDRVVGRIEPGPGDELDLATTIRNKHELELNIHDSARGIQIVEAAVAIPVRGVLQVAKALRAARNSIR